MEFELVGFSSLHTLFGLQTISAYSSQLIPVQPLSCLFIDI